MQQKHQQKQHQYAIAIIINAKEQMILYILTVVKSLWQKHIILLIVV